MPVREEPSEASEMGTCLLFGEPFKVLKNEGAWHYIEMIYDGYRGWLFSRNLASFFITTQELANYQEAHLVSEPFQKVYNESKLFNLGLGTPIPSFDGKNCYVGQEVFQVDNLPWAISGDISNSLTMAEKLIGTPYLWGGRSSYGIDCSGFTQIILRYAGKPLPRDAKDQVKKGRKISSLAKSDPGDLAFFENKKGKISHTGIITYAGEIMHASEQVKKDILDESGIWNRALKQYTHPISAIRRHQ